MIGSKPTFFQWKTKATRSVLKSRGISTLKKIYCGQMWANFSWSLTMSLIIWFFDNCCSYLNTRRSLINFRTIFDSKQWINLIGPFFLTVLYHFFAYNYEHVLFCKHSWSIQIKSILNMYFNDYEVPRISKPIFPDSSRSDTKAICSPYVNKVSWNE